MSFTEKDTTIIKVDIGKIGHPIFILLVILLFLFAVDYLAQETIALSNRC